MIDGKKPEYQFNESVNADMNSTNAFDPIKMSKDFKNMKRLTNTSYQTRRQVIGEKLQMVNQISNNKLQSK